MPQSKSTSMGSEAVTEGVRVRAVPSYLPQHSDPDAKQYTFAYNIRVSNESPAPVTLLARHWVIVDANGERHEVVGDGVVGQQPTILPGQAFEYSSTCPLATAWGTMEGEYTLRRGHPVASGGAIALDEAPADAGAFKIRVARFYLVADSQPAMSV